MKPTAYIETTVPSYLTAWPSRDVVRAGEQQVTRDRWARRSEYELRISSLVPLECGAGDWGCSRAIRDLAGRMESSWLLMRRR